ncbi:hypothetical protein [Candidatus Albibeggiatoa sp. nov. NOAA]|uniref:hypothetical protein n=1 Tax=Candidatus Albibeggiatoa sp. nov. NOAA TaxID=3162724 RepID=UPI003341215C
MMNMKSSYSTYSEVVASGIIQRGWIPEFLPKSAYNIDVKYNLDNNHGFVQFYFSPLDHHFITNHFKIIPYNNQIPQSYLTENRQLYVGKEQFYKDDLLVDWDTNKAMYWYSVALI